MQNTSDFDFEIVYSPTVSLYITSHGLRDSLKTYTFFKHTHTVIKSRIHSVLVYSLLFMRARDHSVTYQEW